MEPNKYLTQVEYVSRGYIRMRTDGCTCCSVEEECYDSEHAVAALNVAIDNRLRELAELQRFRDLVLSHGLEEACRLEGR